MSSDNREAQPHEEGGAQEYPRRLTHFVGF